MVLLGGIKKNCTGIGARKHIDNHVYICYICSRILKDVTMCCAPFLFVVVAPLQRGPGGTRIGLGLLCVLLQSLLCAGAPAGAYGCTWA